MTLELVPPPDDPDGVVQTVQNASPDTWTPPAPARPLHRAERARWGPLVYRIRDLGERRPATVHTVQWAAAAAVQIVQGHAVWGRRLWDAATHAKVREQVRAAQMADDREALAEWTERLDKFKSARNNRLVAMPKAIVGAASLVGAAVLGLTVLAVVGGLLVTHWAGWGWSRYWHWWGGLFGLAATVIAVALVVAKWAFVPGWLLAAWRSGRVTEVPGWLATSAEGDDLVIDEATISMTLGALRIPQIRDYLKRGAPLQYLVPARVDGRGTYFEVRLPAALPAEQLCKHERRAAIASGLHRQTKEVWLGTGADAGILTGWVADKGALEGGAGPYPLLESGTTDWFKGVPFGRNLRGDPMLAPLTGRNTIVGGQPDQGKSTAARTILAGAALDPYVELRIWIPDYNNDFEAFRPRCSSYVMGVEDEHVERIRDDLVELKDEIQERGKLLIQYGIDEVDRAHAHRDLGLHPILCLLEEAHVAVQHAKYGKDISKLLPEIVKLDRKRAIHVVVSTQAPTKDNLPRDVTRHCTNGIAFAVGDHIANDGLLGQGAYRAGHRATDLIVGTDKGTAVVKGFGSQARSELAQAHYIHADLLRPLIARSVDAIERKGRAIPGTGPRRLALTEPVDHLSAIHEAMRGERRARTRDVLARLHEDNAGVYGRWGAKDLAGVLAEHQINIGKSDGQMVVRLDDVIDALEQEGRWP